MLPDYLLHQTALLKDGWTRPWALFLPGPSPAMFILIDSASVKHVCQTRASNYIKSADQLEMTREVLGDGIGTAEGHAWKVQRRIASHHFTLGNVQQHMRHVFVAQTKMLRARVSEASALGQDVDMQDFFNRFTLQCFAQIAFRSDLQLLSSTLPHHEFGDIFDKALELVSLRMTNPLWQLKRLLNIGSERELKLVSAKLHKCVDEFISLALKPDEQQTSASNSEVVSSFILPPDLVSGFQLATATTPEDRVLLHDFVLTMMAAARDTTSSLAGWMLYELIRHEDVQEQVSAEVRGVAPQEFDATDMAALPLLHAVLLECLRLHPPGPMFAKSCVEDDTLPSGVHVPAKSMVLLVPYVAGRNPLEWGEDADQFRPSRWTERMATKSNGDENEVSRSIPPTALPSFDPFSLPVFSAGTRSCLGRHVAILEAKVMVGSLLRDFVFRFAPNSPHLVPNDPRANNPNYTASLISCVRGGLRVRVTSGN